VPNDTALSFGSGGDLVSDEDITGVSQTETTTTGTGTVGTASFSLAVSSTTGFAASGYVWLASNNCSAALNPPYYVLVAYSGTSGGNTFTGCTVDGVTNTLGASAVSPTWASSAAVIQAMIKLPRSKVVIGASGTDGGDVSSTNPMPVLINNAAACSSGRTRAGPC
jgi:hypothetical protein